MRNFTTFGIFAVAFGLLAGAARAGVSPALQAKLDVQYSVIEKWAADPVIVAAVRAQNSALPAALAQLNQDTWTELNLLDPRVRGLMNNPAGLFLRGKRSDVYSEAFVSAADGTKVGFMAKPTNWSHHGKPKHDLPMQGQRWQGAVEVDASTGVQQIQISVPVLDEGHPIGSLVVGLSLRGLVQ